MIVTALVMPLAAVTTSLAYHRLLAHKGGFCVRHTKGKITLVEKISRSGHDERGLSQVCGCHPNVYGRR